MSVRSVAPRSPALAALVESLSYVEDDIPHTLERILPGGRTHLMVNLHEDEFRTYSGADCSAVHRTQGAVLEGPSARSKIIDTSLQRCLVIVDFKINGAAPFLDSPVSETRDQLIEIDQFWGPSGRTLRERILEARTPEAKLEKLEQVLAEQLSRFVPPHPAIPYAVSLLERGLSVAEVTSHLGMLPRTFSRRFERETGLTPKRFSRLRRLQRVLTAINHTPEIDWAEFAVEHGYSDQAHFIHDFRDLTGMTPTEYQPRSPEERNHVTVPATV